jgi:D-alanine-D-alanine ligase
LGENGKLYIVETNTLPGLTTGSLLPKQLAAANIPFESFLDSLVAAATAK